jgi:hypothetical protein
VIRGFTGITVRRRSQAFFDSIDPQRPFATANYRIAKDIYSIASSAGAGNAGGLDNCRAGPFGV